MVPTITDLGECEKSGSYIRGSIRHRPIRSLNLSSLGYDLAEHGPAPSNGVIAAYEETSTLAETGIEWIYHALAAHALRGPPRRD